LFSCRILYAASISRTTMAICSNHSSLLYEGIGIGRPVGGDMYCVSSTTCSPNFKWTIRMFALNTPSILSYSLPDMRNSDTFSKDRTLVKKTVSRSISATVKPIISGAPHRPVDGRAHTQHCHTTPEPAPEYPRPKKPWGCPRLPRHLIRAGVDRV